MSENRKLKVFLCHSKDDKPQVREFYRCLIDDGYDAWLDEEKIVPGQNWDLEIRKAIRNTDIVIVFLTHKSTTKEGYIQKEFRMALDIADEKPEGTNFLVPAKLEECTVPNRIRDYQWVDLFEGNGYSKLLKALRFRMNDLSIRFPADDVVPINNRDKLSIPKKVSFTVPFRIPILKSIAAGLPLPDLQPGTIFIADEGADTVDIARSLLPPTEQGSDLFALEVRGNSMVSAMVYDGDIVIMKPVIEAKNGEMVAVWLSNENSAILTYLFKERGGYRLQPANPTMKPIYVKKTEPLEIKGRVIMVIRKPVD